MEVSQRPKAPLPPGKTWHDSRRYWVAQRLPGGRWVGHHRGRFFRGYSLERCRRFAALYRAFGAETKIYTPLKDGRILVVR